MDKIHLAEILLKMNAEQRAELRADAAKTIADLTDKNVRMDVRRRMLAQGDKPAWAEPLAKASTQRRKLRGALKAAREMHDLAGLGDNELKELLEHPKQKQESQGNYRQKRLMEMLEVLGMTPEEMARLHGCSTSIDDLFPRAHAKYEGLLLPSDQEPARSR
jgi:hypothetical protein